MLNFREKSYIKKKTKVKNYLFHCSSSKEYINMIYKCDGEIDCLDKSDEENCKIDELNFFICDKDRKIHLNFLCNFKNDCEDETDEKFCGKFE